MAGDDMELVRRYAVEQSESAFAAIVSRHAGLVYSASLRLVRDPQLAEEVTQAVFIILARKADSLNDKTILPGWLYRAACYTSGSALKREHRRQQREQEAYMQSTLHAAGPEAAWEQMAPLLEEGMLRLSQADRDALVLRFFEKRSLNEVGTALGTSEEAAKKRVNRALEKLRKFFSKRGVVSTAAIIAGAVAANSVQAAPATLARSVTAVAVAKGAAASGSTLTLINGALKLMAWTKVKTAVVVGVGLLLASGTAIVTVQTLRPAAPPAWQTPAAATVMPPGPAADKIWDEYVQAFAQANATGLPGANEAFQDPIVRVMTNHPPLAMIRGAGVFAGRTAGMGISEGHVALGMPLTEVLGYAYSHNPGHLIDIPFGHIIVPPELASASYDFVDTMPQGGREALQRALKDQFGLVARREIRENLVLTVKDPAVAGLHKHADDGSISTNRSVNVTMAQVANQLGRVLGVKVTDKTGLAGGFDFTLKPRSRKEEDTKNAILEELGLDLAPAGDGEKVEFLVAEKAQ